MEGGQMGATRTLAARALPLPRCRCWLLVIERFRLQPAPTP